MRGHRQVSRYVARWTGRLCCHSSSVYVIIYLWELINYTTTIMARSSQFAWFYCRVLFFFPLISAVCFLPASSQFRLAASVREFPKQTKVGCLRVNWRGWRRIIERSRGSRRRRRQRVGSSPMCTLPSKSWSTRAVGIWLSMHSAMHCRSCLETWRPFWISTPRGSYTVQENMLNCC